MKSKSRDWDDVIRRVNETGRMTIRMGSPGSAQVTRCRLLKAYNGLFAETEGAFLRLSLEPFGA
jgi:hypothetical protein